MSTSMQGKICLITGSTSGIGKETALALAKMGATVVLVSRDQAKGESVQKEIKEKSGNQNIDLLFADLSSLHSIYKLAEDFQKNYTQLHVLINNAGLVNASRRETVDGLEAMFAVNQLAPFLLTNLLLDTLKASAPARIINVSSDAHVSGYLKLDDLQSKQSFGMMRTYGQSKLALILFTYDLARRLEGTGVTVNCLHPGFVGTNIAQNNVPPFFRGVVRALLSLIATSISKGAETSIYLASSTAVEGVTGTYFVKSAPKQTLPLSHDQAIQQQLWDECTRLVQRETVIEY